MIQHFGRVEPNQPQVLIVCHTVVGEVESCRILIKSEMNRRNNGKFIEC